MPFIENNRTTRSETAVIAVNKELSVIFNATSSHHRSLIVRNREMGREMKDIVLSRLYRAATHFGGSRFFSEIMRRLIRGVREGDKLQALELSSYMGGFVDALLLKSRPVSTKERQVPAPGRHSLNGRTSV